MNPLVYHIISGQSFFTGIGLFLAAAGSSRLRRPFAKRLAALAFVLGTIAVALSSTPIPYVCYAVAASGSALWLISLRDANPSAARTVLFAALWIGAACFEIPYWVSPRLAPAPGRTVAVIGDSVSAGIGGDEKAMTWPKLLARGHDVVVQDLSHIGETAASALKRVNEAKFDAAVIVIEIGGNDLLGSTPAKEFAKDLDALLSRLSGPGRRVLMFELPLPPLCIEFGRVQRSLAAKHGVALVPKRFLLSVLAGGGATLDSIHLSQAGHLEMEKTVWEHVRSALEGERRR
jgi:acyl-CoA thioesterase-1